MLRITGKGVSGGVAMGQLYFVRRERRGAEERRAADPEVELARVKEAKRAALSQLNELYRKALPEVGQQGAALFEIHQMMLEDEDYCDSIDNIIKAQGVNAEYAVAVTSANFSRMFSEMEDNPYMRERAADVKDVSDRLIRCLAGEKSEGVKADSPVIVAADDLTPSETVQLDKSKILAFVTSGGSTNSHTAILARTMGIPAIVGAGVSLDPSLDGRSAVVDSFAGELWVDPDWVTLERLTVKKAEDDHRKELLEQFRGKPNVTKDGRGVLIYANIGSLSELGLVQHFDAGGIGLFRTEFLYLESSRYPTEDELFRSFRTVAETMGGKTVVFRTLDVGADKQIGYFELAHEENPALGLRGIRICLERPGLFRTQMRALYRASAFGKVAVMFPMIASLFEVEEALALASSVRDELRTEGAAFDEKVELGIMIETPAAAIISDVLAPRVDFFSIGTNDLTQYTLAVDRQNLSVERYCDTHHEAVLRLIRTVTENAHAHGKWVGICGELGADVTLTETFLRMGVDELSVSPVKVLELRRAVSELDLGS
ncbi:MAG: phosphoenolpyruvate--protein phosphotransferase [Deltaproteobacteria bacterium]|jgi:phosphotransferase system enzyme I (PtsI)|nr:phosphoenolpyruvate--protein phosphotransferase [Deltaproteobacteria bacterium]